jgi:hypothetical protein
MKYPSLVSNNNDGHVVVGSLIEDPTGTVRARAWKLRAGGLSPTSLTLSDPNDLCQTIPGTTKKFSFDIAAAMEAEAVGSFASNFPQWAENAVLIEIYDDGNADNIDEAKIVFGGGEDQIDEITGPDHLNLGDLFAQIAGKNVWSVLVGYDYDDTGDQSTDVLTFTPFLQKSAQAISDRFLKSASISVYAIDGSTPLVTAADNALSMTISPGLGAGDGTVTVDDTTGVQVNDVLAIDDELVQVTSVDSSTVLSIDRGFDGTSAAAHGDGSELYRSAADAQGVFRCQITNTTSLTVGDNYSLSVSITYKDQSYTGLHQFLFELNDV